MTGLMHPRRRAPGKTLYLPDREGTCAPSGPEHGLAIRSCASSQYFFSISISIPARPAAAAATSVVPLPMKGSSTVSPTKL